MTHELDMQRLTNELRQSAMNGIVQQDRRRWQLPLFWATVGAVAGTLLGLAARLR